jgi:hypothetical protein
MAPNLAHFFTGGGETMNPPSKLILGLASSALALAPVSLWGYARSVDAVLLNQTGQALVLDSYDQSYGCWGNRPPARIEPGKYGTWDAHGCNDVTGPEGHVYYRLETAVKLPPAYFYWDNPFVGSNSFDTSAPSGYESAYLGGKANRTTIFYFIRPFSAGPMACNAQWVLDQLKTVPNDNLSDIDRLLGFITNPFKERGISGWVETGCTAQVVGIPVRDAQHSTDDFWTLDLHLVSFSVSGLTAPNPTSRYLRIEIRGGTGAHAVCDQHQISIRDVVTLSGVVRIDTDGPFLEVHPQADFSYTTPGRDGALETANCQTISGWAWDGGQPLTALPVAIDDGQSLLGQVTANLPRSDGRGNHGFSLPTPTRFLDHQSDTIHVRYGNTSVEIPGSPVPITCLNNATFSNWQGVPWTMTAGQTAQVSVTMLNSGNAPWSSARGYKLGSQAPQDSLTWGTNRVYLAPGESVGQGQAKTFTFNVRPPAAGVYPFQWKMVEDLVEWFGGLTPRVDIQVSPAPPASYAGCFTDDGARALPVAIPGTTNSVESCLQAASAAGYRYAGLQYGGYCFAGDALGYSQVAESQCNMPCTTNPYQTCGGSWRNSVYATGAVVAPTCDAGTDCNVTNASGASCRSFSTDGGATWSPFAWSSTANNDAYCSSTAQQCVNRARCAGTMSWCQWPGSAGARWSTAASCTPVCTPTTCAAQGATCGTIANGCGGTLSCGGCTAPATCGGGGTPNACGIACDATTDCNTTNAAGAYCRSFSTDGGASWSPFAWSSVANNDAACASTAQKCVDKSRCAATTAWCQWPGSGGARWSTAATCTP